MTDTPEPTLGERLDAQARRIAGRFGAEFPWAAPLAVALRHATGLAVGPGERFARVEVSPDEPRRPAPNGRPLPTATVARLAGRSPTAELRAGAAAMRVHDGPAADALARAHRADAVTLGRDVHFRAGHYRPHEERGLGLLAHEATHVHAVLAPGADWRRATGAGRAAEETAAAATERAVSTSGRPTLPDLRAGRVAGPPTPPPAAGAAAAAPAGAASPSAAAPMTAATDREPTAAAPTLDVPALRRELIDGVLADLRRQLRSDFERGG